MRSRFQPGLALAAGVLIAALLALVLMDAGDGPGDSQPAPPPGDGASVQLLPGDGASVQLLPGGGHDAGVAQYGTVRHGGLTLLVRPRGHR